MLPALRGNVVQEFSNCPSGRLDQTTVLILIGISSFPYFDCIVTASETTTCKSGKQYAAAMSK
jgi:hypothetical protein